MAEPIGGMSEEVPTQQGVGNEAGSKSPSPPVTAADDKDKVEKKPAPPPQQQQAPPQQQAAPTSAPEGAQGGAKPAEEESDDEEEDEGKVLEESPCGRWQKRAVLVSQRNVPGIDSAFLAMDTEEGVEVIWNEVELSMKKNFKQTQEKLRMVFDNLVSLDHPNIVKFHKYWLDSDKDKPRVIFITEYMSSGNLKQFLKRTKAPGTKLRQWKRRCQQILSALSYLHACHPAIIHGNLSCDTIFIQHNGLIKIGSVAPDTIHHHVKSYRNSLRNLHYLAPEYASATDITPASDIYSFGMCALEMAVGKSEIENGESTWNDITKDNLSDMLNLVEDPTQRDFITKCLRTKPIDRPSARELLFHPIIFEVPYLKILAAHCVVNDKSLQDYLANSGSPANFKVDREMVLGEIVRRDRDNEPFKVEKAHTMELEKLLEDVRHGLYPLTVYKTQLPQETPLTRPSVPPVAQQESQPAAGQAAAKDTGEGRYPVESRRIISAEASYFRNQQTGLCLKLNIKLDDRMPRAMYAPAKIDETGEHLSRDLAEMQLICREDVKKLGDIIEASRLKHLANAALVEEHEGDWFPFQRPVEEQGESVARLIAENKKNKERERRSKGKTKGASRENDSGSAGSRKSSKKKRREKEGSYDVEKSSSKVSAADPLSSFTPLNSRDGD